MKLIDAEKLKKHYAWWHTDSNSDLAHYAECFDQIVEAQPEVGWIPCSERLPEDETEVLVSTKNFVYMAELNTHFGDRLWEESDGHWTIEGVTAWMPLPEVYIESEE